jgi:hypothetical protein
MSWGVIKTSNREEPIDAKENKRQVLESDMHRCVKKDELLKKRRETY